MGKIIRNGITLASFNYEHGDRLITKSITANDTYNAVDDNADGYSSVTVDVPSSTLITKNIASNGTYNASSDNADGYSSVTVSVASGIPYSANRDIWGALLGNKVNSYGAVSDWQDEVNGSKTMILFELHAGSGYEGMCFPFPAHYNLISGTSYNLTFTLVTPATSVFNSSHWGCKWSATKVTSFNVTPDVDFQKITGEQSVTLPFTADSTNFLVLPLGGLNNAPNELFLIKDIQITEAT